MKLPNKKKLINSKLGRWFSNQINSNWFAKTIIGLTIWVIALIPAWIYFAVRWLIGPEGFWQELAIIAVYVFVMGWLQAGLLSLGCMLTMMLIVEDV